MLCLELKHNNKCFWSDTKLQKWFPFSWMKHFTPKKCFSFDLNIKRIIQAKLRQVYKCVCLLACSCGCWPYHKEDPDFEIFLLLYALSLFLPLSLSLSLFLPLSLSLSLSFSLSLRVRVGCCNSSRHLIKVPKLIPNLSTFLSNRVSHSNLGCVTHLKLDYIFFKKSDKT